MAGKYLLELKEEGHQPPQTSERVHSSPGYDESGISTGPIRKS